MLRIPTLLQLTLASLNSRKYLRFIPSVTILCALIFGLSAPAFSNPPVDPKKVQGNSIWFKPNTFGNAILSPDGTKVAFRSSAANKPAQLVVYDLLTGSANTVASFEKLPVGRIAWVNDKRLVFDLDVYSLPRIEINQSPGLYAVDADGERFVQLIKVVHTFSTSSTARDLLPAWTRLLRTSANKDSDSIWVSLTEGYDNVGGTVDTRFYKLNTVNALSEELVIPLRAYNLVFDSKDELRAYKLETFESGQFDGRIEFKGASGQWKTIQRYDHFRNSILLQHVEGEILYLSSNLERDKSQLVTWNTQQTPPLESRLIAHDEFDVRSNVVVTNNKVVGARFTADAPTTIWFESNFKAVQDRIDKIQASTTNIVQVPLRNAAAGLSPYVLVHSESETNPGVTWVYNSETKKITRLGDVMPFLKGKTVGRTDFVKYAARDGLQIPALLTLPSATLPTKDQAVQAKFPLIVFVHGGPFVRGRSWGWDVEVQLLASKGYAVLQPEFRGSLGFGKKYATAGYKQWGLAMQNDLADGVQWAIAQGLVDPNRICVMGASYGGYAAMMGIINNPELFKCAINFVGVTDPRLLFSKSWTDISGLGRKEYLPILLGDPEKDANQLKSVAPVELASKIKAPVLLAYGGKDRRVEPVHGERMRSALEANKVPHEWIFYPEEGHGWFDEVTNSDFWTRVELFLEKSIPKK
jgi:dipeptidyl aminopeptidase/acylaminoacyl peptidase